ncbi:MAG: hypothetical protein O3A46_17500 [Candidatus Poribacteria bacterium]|nr:hypothetical protein [Candidatus Poribacteria bacterium]
MQGADIVSYDIYPVAETEEHLHGNLWYVAKGLDRLYDWTNGDKTIWMILEASRISNTEDKVSPHQLRAEVWMSLVHGATGIIYFVHQFQPNFVEASLLDDATLSAAAKDVNGEVRALAPILNSPTVENGASVVSSNENVPIDLLVKRHDGATYLFAVAMRNDDTRGRFTLSGMDGAASVVEIKSGRKIELKDGSFEDAFEPYGVRLYKIAK